MVKQLVLLRGICQSVYKPTQAIVSQEQTKKMGRREKLFASLLYQPARSPAEPPKVGAKASVDIREKQCVTSGLDKVKPLKGVHQPDESFEVAVKIVGVKAQKVRWESPLWCVCQPACLLNEAEDASATEEAKLHVSQAASQPTKTKMVWEEGAELSVLAVRAPDASNGKAQNTWPGTVRCVSQPASQAPEVSARASSVQADKAQAKNTFEEEDELPGLFHGIREGAGQTHDANIKTGAVQTKAKGDGERKRQEGGPHGLQFCGVCQLVARVMDVGAQGVKRGYCQPPETSADEAEGQQKRLSVCRCIEAIEVGTKVSGVMAQTTNSREKTPLPFAKQSVVFNCAYQPVQTIEVQAKSDGAKNVKNQTKKKREEGGILPMPMRCIWWSTCQRAIDCVYSPVEATEFQAKYGGVQSVLLAKQSVGCLTSWLHRAATLLLPLLLFVCGVLGVAAQEEITNANIRTAVRNWKDNNPSQDALTKYGNIEEWDTSRVSNMENCKLTSVICVAQ